MKTDDLTLKLHLLTMGASTTPSFDSFLTSHGRQPRVARTGLANGLELILESGLWVNVPLSDDSPFVLDAPSGREALLRSPLTDQPVSLAPRPAWYSVPTLDGRNLTSIGMLRGDRLAVTLLKDCTYFANGSQCHFCAIKANPSKEQRHKKPADVALVASVALSDPVAPARHIYFNLGNTNHEERGLEDYPELMRSLRAITSAPVHLNQTAPPSRAYVQHLKSIGFDELSFNIEFANEELSRKLLPGKLRDVPLDHCLAMLEAAVDHFAFPNVTSSLIVGIESESDSLLGIELLMARGVVPKLSIFRPLRGSRLAGAATPSVDSLLNLHSKAMELSEKYSVPLGPLCTPCRMLSLIS